MGTPDDADVFLLLEKQQPQNLEFALTFVGGMASGASAFVWLERRQAPKVGEERPKGR